MRRAGLILSLALALVPMKSYGVKLYKQDFGLGTRKISINDVPPNWLSPGLREWVQQIPAPVLPRININVRR